MADGGTTPDGHYWYRPRQQEQRVSFRVAVALTFPDIFCSNVNSHFRDRQFLMFPSKSIHTDGIHPRYLKCFIPLISLQFSFSFSQVINPRYLFATLEASYYEAYNRRHRSWR